MSTSSYGVLGGAFFLMFGANEMPGFLGSTKTKTVHHLANMKKHCNVNEIHIHEKKYFEPDTLDQAVSEGYAPCDLCNKGGK